jgi:hypothetical protein
MAGDLRHSMSTDSLSDSLRSPRDTPYNQGAFFGTSLQQLLLESLAQRNNPKKLVPEWIQSSANYLMNEG